MKRKIAATLIFAFSLFMIAPSAGYSWDRGHSRHYHGYGDYYGWVPAAIIAGTFLTTAIIIGAANQNAQPAYQQPPAYVDPGPTAYYPPSGQPYAAPAPVVNPRYTPGEWVAVPGQWVGNTWVPYHTVFVPTNP